MCLRVSVDWQRDWLAGQSCKGHHQFTRDRPGSSAGDRLTVDGRYRHDLLAAGSHEDLVGTEEGIQRQRLYTDRTDVRRHIQHDLSCDPGQQTIRWWCDQRASLDDE